MLSCAVGKTSKQDELYTNSTRILTVHNIKHYVVMSCMNSIFVTIDPPFKKCLQCAK